MITANIQSNPDALIADLVELARTYGWFGDYLEVRDFVEWSIDHLGKDADNYELEPYED
jgi:hypothetical protein